ncbi:Hypothetical predicted protein [Lecanosticta acicola]|uniref:Uncharacterized protein n=1 Tax=Lecanosticta acicola TaxID=111012 RepID=A0AAI9EEM6_9PEZI|nr:Hypothetical predicted protein [Lecanosticta acicola]
MPSRIPEVWEEWQEAMSLADDNPRSQQQLLQTISAARRRRNSHDTINTTSPQNFGPARTMPFVYSLMDQRSLQDYILRYPDFCDSSHPETMQNSPEGFAEGLCFLRALPRIVLSVKDQASREDRTKTSSSGSGHSDGFVVQFREWLNPGPNSRNGGPDGQNLGSRAEGGDSSQLRTCIDMTLAASEVVLDDLMGRIITVEGIK